MNSSTFSSITDSGLDSYTAPSGAVYTSTGIYMDTIPNVAGCDSVITIDLSMNFTGLEELTVSAITIFPNPAIDVITLEGLDGLDEIRSIIIVDLTGAMIKVVHMNIEHI